MDKQATREAVIEQLIADGEKCECGHAMPFTDQEKLCIRYGFDAGLAAASAWVPVLERFPEQNKPILITDGRWVGEGHFEDLKFWWGIECEGNQEVTAWMPLPEPYKGE